MILADKIINERKKNGWSQEELAEMLSVSRQSVSKWESAQAIPDLQKILKLAEIFGVSTDYLLKDELEPEEAAATSTSYMEMVEDVPPVKKVSLEEANNYINATRRETPKIAIATGLCICSPVPLIALAGLAESGIGGFTENVAAGIGVVILLLMIAAAVYTFISCGMVLTPYDYLKKTNFETEYGVSGMVKELKADFSPKYVKAISIGVILCILCAVPVIVCGVTGAPEFIAVLMVCLLLVIIAVAVNMFINAGSLMGAYNVLLEEDDYTRKQKAGSKKLEPVMGAYWMICTAVYLGASFLTGRWDMTWIIWPVAGVLSAVIGAIARIFINTEE